MNPMLFTLLALVVPILCFVVFKLSNSLNAKNDKDIQPSISLVVLSGMIAALAIVITLGSGLLPDGRFSWSGWLLLGSLLAAIACTSGMVYSLIQMHDGTVFQVKDRLYVMGWINASWSALGLLSLCFVLTKVFPARRDTGQSPTLPGSGVRYLVAHELPELGSGREAVKSAWGLPAVEQGSQLIYRTSGGLTAFCLDASSKVQTIIESKETDANAIGKYCKSN